MNPKQVEDSFRAELAAKSGEADNADSSKQENGENNQDPNKDSQSGTDKQVTEFTLADGRKITQEDILDALDKKDKYGQLLPEFTRRSQELAELKKPKTESSDKTEDQKPAATDGGKQLSPQQLQVLQELKDLGVAFSSDIEKQLDDKLAGIEPKIASRAASMTAVQNQLQTAIEQLEEDYDGTEGKPKVEGKKVLEFIVNNPNTDKSPLEIAKYLYMDDFIKFEAAKMGGKPSLPATEDAGSGASTPPTPKYSFKDGSAERGLRAFLNPAK